MVSTAQDFRQNKAEHTGKEEGDHDAVGVAHGQLFVKLLGGNQGFVEQHTQTAAADAYDGIDQDHGKRRGIDLGHIQGRGHAEERFGNDIGNDAGGSCGEDHLGGDLLVGFLQCKGDAGKGCVEGGGKARAGAAEQKQLFVLVIAFGQTLLGELAGHCAQLDGGAFAAQGKTADDAKGAADEFLDQYGKGIGGEVAVKLPFQLRNAAAFDQGFAFGNSADNQAYQDQKQEQQSDVQRGVCEVKQGVAQRVGFAQHCPVGNGGE